MMDRKSGFDQVICVPLVNGKPTGEKNVVVERPEFGVKKNRVAVYLTSFADMAKYTGTPYAITKKLPPGVQMEILDFFDVEDADDNVMKIADYTESPEEFAKKYKEALKKRWKKVKKWLDSIQSDTILCCWCPYSPTAQKNIKEKGVFFCHTGLVAKVIRRHRPDLTVVFDDDRTSHLYPAWKN